MKSNLKWPPLCSVFISDDNFVHLEADAVRVKQAARNPELFTRGGQLLPRGYYIDFREL